MFGKILLAIDGSEYSMKAADYALQLAQIDHGQVEILHVAPPLNHYMRDSESLLEDLKKELIEEGERIIAKGAAKFKDSGIEFTTKVLTGDPADVICDEVEQNGIKVIVMGSRGLNAVSRFILGSVSSKVLSHACSSVLIVR